MKKNLRFYFLISFCLTVLQLQSFAQVQNNWTRKGDFSGIRRAGAVGFSIGTKGYLGTGIGSNDSVLRNDFWEYDPTVDAWSQKADFLGTARSSAVGFSIGSKGYLGTGSNGKERFKDFWEYDPSTNTWTQKADFGGSERLGSVGFSIGTKGYIGTGHNNIISGHTNDFWEYDPENDIWTQKANFAGQGRTYATGFSIENKGYIGTGNIGKELLNDFYEYDPSTDTWTMKSSFPGIKRYGAFGTSDGTYGYVVTGRNYEKENLNDFWEYDPISDKWKQKASFDGNIRSAASGFNIGNKIYIGTGEDGKYYLGDFWEYNSLSTVCDPPVVISEPANQTITYGDATSFQVQVSNATSYQWQQNDGSGYVDITDGGIFLNTSTSILNISFPTVAMSGFKYRCLLKGNGFGECLPIIATNGAILTVTPFPVIITPDADQSKVYGSADNFLLGYSFTPSLVGSDFIAGKMERMTGENVGSYSFTLGSLSAGSNYNLSISVERHFTITNKDLFVQAEDKYKCSDGLIFDGIFTVVYSGFVNSEDQNELNGVLVFNGTALTANTPGLYSIEPTGLSSLNYSINYANGSLNINSPLTAPFIRRSGDTLISNYISGNKWFLDGVELTKSSEMKYIVAANGDYYAIVMGNGCNTEPSNSISILDVSFKEIRTELFEIYPNPSNGKFNIMFLSASKEMFNIEIFNGFGKIVWNLDNIGIDSINSLKIDLNILSAGVYTVVLKNNTKSFVKKVLLTK